MGRDGRGGEGRGGGGRGGRSSGVSVSISVNVSIYDLAFRCPNPSHLCRSIALQQNDINISSSSSSSSSSGYCYFYCYDDDCYSSSFLVVLVLQRLPPKLQRLQLQLRQLSEQLSNGQTYHHKHCNPLAHFLVNMLPNMMKFAALEQKTHEVIASASPQPWIARAEDQYPRLGLDASVQEKHETPIRMEGNVLPKPQATRQWPWDRGGSGREKDRAGG